MGALYKGTRDVHARRLGKKGACLRCADLEGPVRYRLISGRTDYMRYWLHRGARCRHVSCSGQWPTSNPVFNLRHYEISGSRCSVSIIVLHFDSPTLSFFRELSCDNSQPHRRTISRAALSSHGSTFFLAQSEWPSSATTTATKMPYNSTSRAESGSDRRCTVHRVVSANGIKMVIVFERLLRARYDVINVLPQTQTARLSRPSLVLQLYTVR